MSCDIVNTVKFTQSPFQYVPQEILGGNAIEDFTTLGGILSDLKHLWQAKGPCLEVRNTAGRKVGSWTFGGILKDSNTKIVAVDELKRPHGRLSLLAVALECTISGGLVCVFDIFGSKVLRVVHVREQITSLHVIDSGCENSVLPEPSPLRYFDGIIAVGMLGGNVYLLDICRQICENGIHNVDITTRDELNPCPMIILNKEKITNIKKYVERSVDREEHLAIHLNVILNSSSEHFTLKGEDGEDRVHVNHLETEVSSLFHSSQIASLLVGYNFGAFQLWNLRSLELVYTSPICEEHIPVMHFSVQEPADDPKAYCYIWVSYSHNLMFNPGLPFAVMYSFYYDTKNYVNGYGNLYENFQHCSVRFQIELGDTETPSYNARAKGGTCIGLQSLNRYPINKDLNSLSLCSICWLVWNSHGEVNTSVLVFDLNQWYKEQMPRVPNWSHCSNYIIRHSLSNQPLLDVKLDQRSLSQFIGIQRLEEHFCPTALSFDLWCISEDDILKVHNKGLQQAFLHKIVKDQHLSLVKPDDYFEQIASLGLVPIFCEPHLNTSLDMAHQREILLNVALEHKLIGWLCKSTSALANNAFNASGLTLHNLLNWAFERAITLKNSCDKYCVPLFDYSGTRLDNNTITMLNSCTVQIGNICSLYKYVSNKLMRFISDKEVLLEEQRSLENVVVYFEVLLWMVNIGLLPECQRKSYCSYDDSFTSAPYLVDDLTQYYNRKRAQLQMASHDTFVEKDCLLYIDNLINVKGGAEILRQQWQEDGGSGLYPPPSLQSVLRTYFLHGPDLNFKHCLVTYTLLDIAMTVDENNKVIKLLLKFPQIFDLSQSNVKIVQAFWHLDHDDYETALEYILDPCALTEDLHRWHHSVMMRSLLLQDKPSLALLYLQIRKPSIQDEKDLLTVISLLISKNMLDEAFKFRQQHQSPNEHALLLHIFNECNKNELLHSLLYRRLSNGEEAAFFKYLKSTKNPRCEDLKIFYYLLRSRFLEALDSYSAINRKKPENQGLVGQRDATTADNIVKMFRTLLPDVNKNLVELVRKERTNLWKEVRKPTPLSVFVHNAKDQVQYKSSVIFAALAKAKQTFNETLNETKVNNDVLTEETPFLRTPTVFRSVAAVGTPLVKSKVIEHNELGEEYGPSPCKKLKLSPRTSKTTPANSRNLSVGSVQSKLNTPIIRRKRLSVESSNDTAVLPQSILKGSSATRTILDDSILDGNTSVNTSLQLECENSVRRSRLTLTPRKPVSRTPLKSHVKFDDLSYSNSSLEQSSKNDSTLQQLIPETSRSMSVNSEASTVDEIFYSPENSPEDGGESSQKRAIEGVDERIKKTSLSPVREKLSFDETMTGDDVFLEDPSKKRSETSKISVENDDLSTNRLMFQSPRSRRTYKRSFGESPIPIRSSPRLAKKTSREESEDSDVTSDKSESLMKPSPSVAVQKLRGRKSLSRAVLENNAFATLKSDNLFEEKKFLEQNSGISSLNTTTSESEIEIDTEPSDNCSLEELLAKYRSSDAFESDSSINKTDSLLWDSGRNLDIFKDGDVSKITEMQNIETHREILRKRDTNELVFSKETREEHQSKKVDFFEQDDVVQKLGDGNAGDNSIFAETTQEYKPKAEEGNEVPEEHKSINQEENNDTALGRYEEINVYEDLSSSGDDLGEVLKQFAKKNDGEKTYADISFSTSGSYYQNERKDELMPENVMDSGESNSNDEASKSPQPTPVYDNDVDMEAVYDDIPPSERAFIDSDVIEIGSSSDDDDKRNKKRRDTDSSERSSSSSSEDKLYSSNDDSSDYAMNVAFDDDLIDQEQTNINDILEEQTTGYNQDKNVEEDRRTNDSGEDSDTEPEEIAKDPVVFHEESSKSSFGDEVSGNIERRQSELDQKEIAAAIKMLQTDYVAEEQVLGADDEHMDSLILEEQSSDIQDVASKGLKFAGSDENRSVAIIEEQKIVESDRVLEENPQEQNADVEKLSDKVAVETSHVKENVRQTPYEPSLQYNEATTSKVSKSLQCTLGANDFLQDSPAKDSTEYLNIDETETPSPSVKKSISIQCTLGAINTLLESSVEDTSVFQEDDQEPLENKTDMEKTPLKKSISLQCTIGDTLLESCIEDDTSGLKVDQEPPENEDKDMKGTPIKHSISLQCTLSTDDSILGTSLDDSVFVKDNESMGFNEDGVMAENKDRTVDLVEKEPSMSASKHTISLQCTLGAKDSILESTADDSSSKDNENVTRNEEEPVDLKNKTVDVVPVEGSAEDLLRTYPPKTPSEASTSQSTTSQTPSSKHITTLSQLSESMFDSNIVELPPVHVERDIMEMTLVNATVKPRVEPNILEPMDEGKETPSEASTSQSTTSQTASSRRITRLSQLSESMFDSNIVNESPAVRMEPDIMEMTLVDGAIKPRVETNILTTMDEGKETPSEASTSQSTPSSRRITRLSQLSESMFDSNIVNESPAVRVELDIMEKTLAGSAVTPRVKRDVSKVVDEMEGKNVPEAKLGPSKIRSRRSSKESFHNKPSTSQKPASYAVGKKRARSASVDQPLANARKKSVRSKSIDLNDLNVIAAKMDLRVTLTPVVEQVGPSTEAAQDKEKQTTKAYSDVGAYTTSRRLTRRQAGMLKSIGKVEAVRKLASVEEMDPLHLLDRAEFAGKADPDESKVYEEISPSSSSGTLSRHTRSASVLSDVVGTPTKRGSKAKIEHVDSPISGIKTRLRSQSTDTMSVVSEQSDSPSPTKKFKKKDDKNDSPPVKSAKIGERRSSRASSISSTKSAASEVAESSVRTTRSRKLGSAKSDLPEIKEEKDSEEVDVNTSVIKRRGRKKK